MKPRVIDVEGTSVPVSNLEKVFYPRTGFTKGDIINYYIRMSPMVLSHLKNRPVTLKRYPDGVNGGFFYEKQCPSHRPKWVKTTPVPKSDGGTVNYCIIDSLPSLVWAANLADLELHTFLHKASTNHQPTAMVFDLDPGLPADIKLCCKIALIIKHLFDSMKLECYPKTSGSKGLQLYVPLNSPTTYERTKGFARAVAEVLERRSPRTVTSSMQKIKRVGKVFVDWSQNDDHKTTVAVYSLRAMDRPTVSTPLKWEEVERAAKRLPRNGLVFDSSSALKRAEEMGDLFEPVLSLRQQLPAVSELETDESR